MDRTTGSAMAVAGGSIVLYALSPPPVAWVLLKLGGTGSGLSVIYAPLQTLYDHFPPYKALIDAAFRILGIF